MGKRPRILFFDVETSYILARVWRTGKQVVSHDQIVDGWAPKIICICYKWAGARKVHSLEFNLKTQDCKEMILEFAQVVRDADICVAHNGKSFDIKQVNTQLLLNDLPPIPWPTMEDTLKQVRKYFFLPSYSLDYVSKLLTGSGKSRMGFRDWVDIIEHKNQRALDKMVRYCKRDVQKLYQSWKRCSKYMEHVAHVGQITESGRDSCPRCGSKHVVKDGNEYLKVGVFSRQRCQSCKYPWRSSRRVR